MSLYQENLTDDMFAAGKAVAKEILSHFAMPQVTTDSPVDRELNSYVGKSLVDIYCDYIDQLETVAGADISPIENMLSSSNIFSLAQDGLRKVKVLARVAAYVYLSRAATSTSLAEAFDNELIKLVESKAENIDTGIVMERANFLLRAFAMECVNLTLSTFYENGQKKFYHPTGVAQKANVVIANLDHS